MAEHGANCNLLINIMTSVSQPAPSLAHIYDSCRLPVMSFVFGTEIDINFSLAHPYSRS
eukprot:SAG11_NODE_909_length_6586_cov_11.216433_5_plen_59_part_00